MVFVYMLWSFFVSCIFLVSCELIFFLISIFCPHLSLNVSFNSFMVASTIKTKTKHYNGLLTRNLKAITYFIMMKHLKNREMLLIWWKFLDFFKPSGFCISFSLFYYFFQIFSDLFHFYVFPPFHSFLTFFVFHNRCILKMMKMLLLFILWMLLIERWSCWWWWLWFFAWKKLVDVIYAWDKPTTITCVLAHEKQPIVIIVVVVMLNLAIIDNVFSHEVPIVVVPMSKDSLEKIYDVQFWN